MWKVVHQLLKSSSLSSTSLSFSLGMVEFVITQCSPIEGCLGKRLGAKMIGRNIEQNVPEVTYQVLEEPSQIKESEVEIPQSLEEFVTQMKHDKPDAKAFDIKLKSMVNFLEQGRRTAKIQEY